MKTKILTFVIVLSFSFFGYSQSYMQYFDGADTICNPDNYDSSICITIDSSSSNIWQLGTPQKVIFSDAATLPYAIMTDTINYYPANNSSSFEYTIVPWTNWGVLAIQWKQKLDMEYGRDGGIVEFSTDEGNTWVSAFNNPYVYNYYGYEEINVGTIHTGEVAFTGTDSLWQDIWLCYDMTWLSGNENIMIRHTFVSDSIETNQEGWMIDNLLIHTTIIHTVNEMEQEEYMTVSPNPTDGRINIRTRKIDGPHIIEKMQLLDIQGSIVENWGSSPTKFYLDISNHPSGVYFLKIKTNLSQEIFKIILEH